MSDYFASWLSDVQDAYSYAISEFNKGKLDIFEKTDLYKVAPIIAAQRKKISDPEIIEEMCEFVYGNAEQDFTHGEDSKKNYKFHFVISYIHSHAPAGIITEMEGDRIMEYVNDEWELFDRV